MMNREARREPGFSFLGIAKAKADAGA